MKSNQKASKPVIFAMPSEYVVVKDVELIITGISDTIDILKFDMLDALSIVTEVNILAGFAKTIKDESIIGKDASFAIKYKNQKIEYKLYVDHLSAHFISSNNKAIAGEKVLKTLILCSKIGIMRYNIKSKVYAIGCPADTLKALFKSYNFKTQIKVNIQDRRIRCQYNESDYNFLLRICSYYHLGFYYDPTQNTFIVHDKPCYSNNYKFDLPIDTLHLHSIESSNVEHISRTQWSTNTVKGKYSAKSGQFTRSYFVDGYISDQSLKVLSEQFAYSMTKDVVIYENLYVPVFAGAKLNNMTVSKHHISFISVYEITICCIKSGIEIPKFFDTRGCLTLPGLTQLKVDEITENQSIMDEKKFEIPVKMFFDPKELVHARQPFAWLGKFYGSYFPIREQIEVMVIFTDSLMSTCCIVNCYANNANSIPFEDGQVGIKTATLRTTSSEKFMNQLVFQDKKDDEIVKLEGKKKLVLNADEEIVCESTKFFNLKSETLKYELTKNASIEAKEIFNIKAKEVKVESENKQEVTTKDEYHISASKKVVIKSDKISLGKKDIVIEGNSLSIDVQQLNIKAENITMQGSNFQFETKVFVLQCDIFKLTSKIGQLQFKLFILKSELLKLEANLNMLESKLVLLKAQCVMVV